MHGSSTAAPSRARRRLAVATAALGTVVASVVTVVSTTGAHAEGGCEVDYTVVNDWGSGFQANVAITAGEAIDGWTVEWDFTSAVSSVSAWNAADPTLNGAHFSASDVGWNASIASGETREVFGFTASGTAGGITNAAVNGDPCDGATSPPTDDPTDDPTDPGGGEQGDLEGWATQNGGTTGGAGGSTTTVSSASALVSAIEGDSAKTVRVSGSINLSGMNDVGSNTTIVGESGARITGGGFDVDGAHNVIITNLTFDDWDDDAINVQEGSTNVWIDHNTFGTGHDGSVDIKRESDFITVSWNRFDGSQKNMLLGHSDGHTADIGHLRVSYHHNYFNGTNSRNPRVRFGETVHVYNNYYYDIGSYGVATTMNAGVLFEGNYLENVDTPTEVGYGSSDPGRIVSRDNHLVDSSTPDNSGSVAPVPYAYSLDTPSQVKSIVTAGAGAS